MNIVNFKASEVLINMFKEDKAAFLLDYLIGVVLGTVAGIFIINIIDMTKYDQGYIQGCTVGFNEGYHEGYNYCQSNATKILNDNPEDKIPSKSNFIQQLEDADRGRFDHRKL